jgi:uncharacterized protein VirK/YbjX
MRLELLREHYEFLIERFARPELNILFGPGWELPALPVPELQQFRLSLIYPPHSKEGELGLRLVNTRTRTMVMVLTFSFIRLPADDWGVFIGCLQGSKSPEQKELVIHLTRSLHGLRPKALLVFVVQQMARLWGLSAIHAVGGREHIYRHYRKRRTFNANYDEFWLECQGELRADGNYELPLAPAVRPLEDLPRNKRPVYRKRYQMLEQLARALERGLPPGEENEEGRPNREMLELAGCAG